MILYYSSATREYLLCESLRFVLFDIYFHSHSNDALLYAHRINLRVNV